MDISNEFLICFGTEPTKSADKITTLPISYETTNYKPIVQIMNVDNGNTRRISNVTTSSFKTHRTGEVNTAYYWITVGY